MSVATTSAAGKGAASSVSAMMTVGSAGLGSDRLKNLENIGYRFFNNSGLTEQGVVKNRYPIIKPDTSIL